MWPGSVPEIRVNPAPRAGRKPRGVAHACEPCPALRQHQTCAGERPASFATPCRPLTDKNLRPSLQHTHTHTRKQVFSSPLSPPRASGFTPTCIINQFILRSRQGISDMFSKLITVTERGLHQKKKRANNQHRVVSVCVPAHVVCLTLHLTRATVSEHSPAGQPSPTPIILPPSARSCRTRVAAPLQTELLRQRLLSSPTHTQRRRILSLLRLKPTWMRSCYSQLQDDRCKNTAKYLWATRLLAFEVSPSSVVRLLMFLPFRWWSMRS